MLTIWDRLRCMYYFYFVPKEMEVTFEKLLFHKTLVRSKLIMQKYNHKSFKPSWSSRISSSKPPNENEDEDAFGPLQQHRMNAINSKYHQI